MALTLQKIGQGLSLLLDAGTWRDASGGGPSPPPLTRRRAEVRVIEEDPRRPAARRGSGRPLLDPGVDGLVVVRDALPARSSTPRTPTTTNSAPAASAPATSWSTPGPPRGLFTRFALAPAAADRVIAVEPFGPMAEALRRTFAPEVAAGDSPGRAGRCLRSARAVARLTLLDPSQPWGATISPEGDGDGAGEVVSHVTIDELVERLRLGPVRLPQDGRRGGRAPRPSPAPRRPSAATGPGSRSPSITSPPASSTSAATSAPRASDMSSAARG